MSDQVRKTLVYVDRDLAIAVAAKLVGVLRSRGEGQKSFTKLNWFIQVGSESSETSSDQFDIRQMLPEDIVYLFYNHIAEKHDNVGSILHKLTTGVKGALVPGDVISIRGILNFPNLKLPDNYSPFDDANIKLPSTYFHGEECIVAKLEGNGYTLPVYIPEEAKFQTCFCHDEPTEITGILRWIPPYRVGGAGSINLAVRCVATWLC